MRNYIIRPKNYKRTSFLSFCLPIKAKKTVQEDNFLDREIVCFFLYYFSWSLAYYELIKKTS